MPRTIPDATVRQPDITLGRTEREVRDCLEGQHWKRLWYHFHWKTGAGSLPDSPADDPVWTIIPDSCDPRAKSPVNLQDMDDGDVRMFCFKDCLLYQHDHHIMQNFRRSDLYNRIYRRWFPSRAEDTDISHGSFFCQYLHWHSRNASTETENIQQIIRFHKALCEQLADKIPHLPFLEYWEPIRIAPNIPIVWPTDRTARLPLLSPWTEYRLRDTFSKCFLVLRAYPDVPIKEKRQGFPIWSDTGAIVVWLQAEDVPELLAGMRPFEGDFGRAVAYECDTLDCAMQHVLSTDSSRALRRSEWHGKFKEVLDQNTSMFGTPCECYHMCAEPV